MLTCIARPKHQHNNNNSNNNDPVSQRDDPDAATTPNSKQAIKTLTSQIKGMAMKASGAYKCNPCAHPSSSNNHLKKNAAASAAESVDVSLSGGVNGNSAGPGSSSDRFKWSGTYKRTTSTNSGSRWGKEMETRLKGLSVGDGTAPVMLSSASLSSSAAASGRRMEPPAVVLMEETEPKEWVAQVEPGVLITFVSLPRGGNDLKRIRFSRDIFNKWQAQKWWTDNYEKVMELYNVQRLHRHAFPASTPSRSEDEISKGGESMWESPVTPPLNRENLPRSLYHRQGGMGYSSSDSLDQHSKPSIHQPNESSGLTSTPKHSNISTTTNTKTETSSVDEPLRSTSSREADRSGEPSISAASDLDSEWVEEDEPGVYITIRALPAGRRELRRVRFSRERFGEMHARVWWEENRARVHEQYL